MKLKLDSLFVRSGYWELIPYRFIIKLNSQNIDFLLAVQEPKGEADEMTNVSVPVLQTRLGTLYFLCRQEWTTVASRITSEVTLSLASQGI